MRRQQMFRVRRIALALAALGGVLGGGLAGGGDALAEGAAACGPRAALGDMLESRHGEVLVAIGVMADGRAIEVFAAAQSGSFTIAVTAAEGVSCVVAYGEGWTPVAPKAIGERS